VFSLLFSPLPAFRNKSEQGKNFEHLMGLKGGDCIRKVGKAEVKIKQREDPLGAVYANRETSQIPTCLSHG